MVIFDVSIIVIILGVLGYIWKLRKTITNLIPGKSDDEVLDTIEGLAEKLEIDVDGLAANSRGKLKKKIKEKVDI